MVRSIAFVVVCIALAACAPHWVKPNATDQEFSRDSSACDAEADQAIKGMDTYIRGPVKATRDWAYDTCMAKKGWTEQ